MVIGIAILYLGFNYLKGKEFFSSTNKYYAVYANINGLNISNPILINGFTIGRVSKIRLLQNNNERVLVELEINEEIIIGDSAIATLNSDFLGNKSIALSPGDILKPLNDGDTLIAVLDRGIADILAETAQPVATSLEATIKKINLILDKLGGAGGKIDSILMNFEDASRELKPSIVRSTNSLDSTLTTYTVLGKNLNSKLNDLEPILSNMVIITDSIKSLQLNQTVASANKALKQLSEAIEQFSTSEGTIGKLMNDDSLYMNLNNAMQSLDQLLIHIDGNPKHFFAPLGKSKSKIEKDRRKAAKQGN